MRQIENHVTQDLPKRLVNLLFVRDSCGVSANDVVPEVVVPVRFRAPQPLERATWITWWREAIDTYQHPRAESDGEFEAGRIWHQRLVNVGSYGPGNPLSRWFGDVFEWYIQVLTTDANAHARELEIEAAARNATALTVAVLPVSGHWITRPRSDYLVVSHGLRQDPGAYRRELARL